MNDQQFRRLLEYFNLSWNGYRKVRKGVKKRVRRHMLDVRANSMDAYLHTLESHPVLREECLCLMTVSISRFFRDREVWNVLENKIIPGFAAGARGAFRVWSAGCGCGEEVYSFKILWKRLEDRSAGLPRLALMGSDMNASYLSRARAGIYPESSLRSIPEQNRARFFNHLEGNAEYQVKPLLKKGIHWVQQDFHAETPSPGFHIIFLRNNLLTYEGAERRKHTFSRIVETLAPGGFLIIGSHESLPECPMSLLPSPHNPHIFQKAIPEFSYSLPDTRENHEK